MDVWRRKEGGTKLSGLVGRRGGGKGEFVELRVSVPEFELPFCSVHRGKEGGELFQDPAIK